MIKVLHVGHSRKWRGGENQVRLLIQGMRSHLFDVKHYIAYPENAQMIKRLSSELSAVLALPSSQPLDPRSIWALTHFCRQHHIDIIDAHSASAHALAYYAKFFLRNIRLVVHRHVNFPVKRTYFTRKKYLSDKVNHYVAISAAIRNKLLMYGIPAQKISLIKSAIDPAPYTGLSKQASKSLWCKRYGWDTRQPLLGFASALDPSKDPEMFVNVVSELIRRGYKVNALIAGRGKLEKRLQLQIQSLNLCGRVKLTGFINQMPELFSAFDIFYLPSLEEGLGTVLLEAIHSECSIVASDVGGIGEIIRHQDTGMLARPGDLDHFVKLTQALLDSAKLRSRLKTNAARHVDQSFNLSHSLRDNYRLYQTLLTL